jgi:hypothetical protein
VHAFVGHWKGSEISWRPEHDSRDPGEARRAGKTVNELFLHRGRMKNGPLIWDTAQHLENPSLQKRLSLPNPNFPKTPLLEFRALKNVQIISHREKGA